MKINDILEAVNASTGTPNPTPLMPPPPEPQDWRGRKKSDAELDGRIEPTLDPKPPEPQPAAATPKPPEPQPAAATPKPPEPQPAPATPKPPEPQPAPATPKPPAPQPAPQPAPATTQPVPQQAATAKPQSSFAQGLKNVGGAISKGVQGAVKGRIPGTDAYNQRKLDKQDDAAITKTAQGYVTQWNNGTKANPALNTPEELQKFGQRLATRANGKALFKPDLPKDMSPAGVTQYFKDIVARSTSGLETGDAATKAPTTTAGPGQNNWDNINKMAAGSDQTQQKSTILDPSTGKPFTSTDPSQSAAAAATSTAPAPDAHDEKDIEHDQVPGMEIVQQEPIIVKYKNREFALDDQGQWVHLGGTKKPHQSFQAMLDKTAGFSESFDPGQMLWNKLNK